MPNTIVNILYGSSSRSRFEHPPSDRLDQDRFLAANYPLSICRVIFLVMFRALVEADFLRSSVCSTRYGSLK